MREPVEYVLTVEKLLTDVNEARQLLKRALDNCENLSTFDKPARRQIAEAWLASVKATSTLSKSYYAK